MSLADTTGQVLAAMITPAVLISASGTLILSTSNRIIRVVDRVRALAVEAEKTRKAPGEDPIKVKEKQELIIDQLGRLSKRAMLLRSAMSGLYVAIGLLTATSIELGILTLLPETWGWLPMVTGLMGASALLFGSIVLVREARMAINSTLKELEYVERAICS